MFPIFDYLYLLQGQPQPLGKAQENGSPKGLNNKTRGKGDPRVVAPQQDKAKVLQPKGYGQLILNPHLLTDHLTLCNGVISHN